MKKVLLILLTVLCAVSAVWAGDLHKNRITLYVSPLTCTMIVPVHSTNPGLGTESTYAGGVGIGFERSVKGHFGFGFDSDVTWCNFKDDYYWPKAGCSVFSVDLLAKATGLWQKDRLMLKFKVGAGAELQIGPEETGCSFIIGSNGALGYRFTDRFAGIFDLGWKMDFQPHKIEKLSSVSSIVTIKLGAEIGL